MATSIAKCRQNCTSNVSHHSAVQQTGRCRVTVRSAQTAGVSTIAAPAKVTVQETGAFTVRGTVRKVNEDRYDVKVNRLVWLKQQHGMLDCRLLCNLLAHVENSSTQCGSVSARQWSCMLVVDAAYVVR